MANSQPLMSRRKFLKKALAAGLLAGFGADAFYFEPRDIDLTKYDVAIPDLPDELAGLKIVQLSDIHRRRMVPDSLIKEAVEIANSTNPDVAVLTGDFVGRLPKDIHPCFEMLSRLKTRLGSFAVLGNHDHWTDAEQVTASMAEHGIHLLRNSSAEVCSGLYLVGIDDQWAGKPDVARAFGGVTSGSAYVMLSHTPIAVNLFSGKRGLLITGHTHGGQVVIPPIPRNWLPGLKGWKYISGWYRERDILMYVNRGIGMVNPPIRTFCRPEVTLFTLHPASGSKTVLISRTFDRKI